MNRSSSDTGVSGTDNVTSVTNPTFDVSGIEVGATLRLLRNGVVVWGIEAAGELVPFVLDRHDDRDWNRGDAGDWGIHCFKRDSTTIDLASGGMRPTRTKAVTSKPSRRIRSVTVPREKNLM